LPRDLRIRFAHAGLIGFILALMVAGNARAVGSTPQELRQAEAWARANFKSSGPREQIPPFSFVYDGRPSADLLRRWKFAVGPSSREGSKQREEFTYRDPSTGLELTCDLTYYDDFPAVEWVLSFMNNSAKPTPILEDVRALEAQFQGPGGSFMLHRALGSNAAPSDFSPVDQPLSPGGQVDLAPPAGRSSDTTSLPFFNLEAPAGDGCRGANPEPPQQRLCGGGVMIGVGWSGQWSANFRGAPGAVQLKMGMERMHLRLLPGESIRTPRMLLIFWQGADRIRANNLLRSFILAYHTPRPGGRLLQMPVAHNTWFQFHSGNSVTEQNQIEFASLIRQKNIAIDTLVIDAGWFEGGWPHGVGNWFPRKDAFPRGLGPVGQAVHQLGMRFSVWFEPERVSEGTWLYTHHRDWLLEEGQRTQWLDGKDKQDLLNLGNPEARRWLTDMVSDAIDQDGIDIFRHDFNIDPLTFWRKADAPDRQGITEIRYIEGLYAFWDELLRRHPNLMIDNCASGGRRIDLETSSRSVPLWRTDLGNDPVGEQSLGLGLNLYIPLNSAGLIKKVEDQPDLYQAHSTMSAGIIILWDVRKPDLDVALARQIASEEKAVSKYYYGDVYPLTPITTDEKGWLSYQCNRPDLGEGMVMAFRRKLAAEEVLTVKLQGLKPAKTYEVEDVDSGKKQLVTGRELAAGLRLTLANPQSSTLLIYREAN
jgi:alpha-galactosidase